MTASDPFRATVPPHESEGRALPRRVASTMHSTFSRLNAVTALATTVILVLVVLIDFSSHNPKSSASLPNASKSGQVTVNQLQVVRGKAAWHMDRNIQDFVQVSFDIDADFTGLFNWNTKQVFVSLAAQYDTKKHVSLQSVSIFWYRD